MYSQKNSTCPKIIALDEQILALSVLAATNADDVDEEYVPPWPVIEKTLRTLAADIPCAAYAKRKRLTLMVLRKAISGGIDVPRVYTLFARFIHDKEIDVPAKGVMTLYIGAASVANCALLRAFAPLLRRTDDGNDHITPQLFFNALKALILATNGTRQQRMAALRLIVEEHVAISGPTCTLNDETFPVLPLMSVNRNPRTSEFKSLFTCAIRAHNNDAFDYLLQYEAEFTKRHRLQRNRVHGPSLSICLEWRVFIHETWICSNLYMAAYKSNNVEAMHTLRRYFSLVVQQIPLVAKDHLNMLLSHDILPSTTACHLQLVPFNFTTTLGESDTKNVYESMIYFFLQPCPKNTTLAKELSAFTDIVTSTTQQFTDSDALSACIIILLNTLDGSYDHKRFVTNVAEAKPTRIRIVVEAFERAAKSSVDALIYKDDTMRSLICTAALSYPNVSLFYRCAETAPESGDTRNLGTQYLTAEQFVYRATRILATGKFTRQHVARIAKHYIQGVSKRLQSRDCTPLDVETFDILVDIAYSYDHATTDNDMIWLLDLDDCLFALLPHMRRHTIPVPHWLLGKMMNQPSMYARYTPNEIVSCLRDLHIDLTPLNFMCMVTCAILDRRQHQNAIIEYVVECERRTPSNEHTQKRMMCEMSSCPFATPLIDALTTQCGWKISAHASLLTLVDPKNHDKANALINDIVNAERKRKRTDLPSR